jgi:cytochrome c oxidase assembly protein subunit 15
MKSRAIAFGALLVLQVALIVTGGAVRLTGSGLGCPTWPECTPGSYVPVKNQAEGQLHAWIEFGNRLLTFALVAAALIVLAIVLKNGRKDLRQLALGQVLGIFGQGILGGITVLTDLNPIPVAGHLLLSIILVAGAASLFDRRNYPAKIIPNTRHPLSIISRIHIALTFIVIVLGTVVTGSGPHAGDASAKRFDFDIRTVAILHADAVIALLGISLTLYFVHSVSPQTKKLLRRFFLIALLQGFIGYLQYFTGIPEVLVAAHLLGAGLVWISAWRVRLSISHAKQVSAETT